MRATGNGGDGGKRSGQREPAQQNASRTPSREDALSALERVRQAAKKDKKLRFTALLHHIYDPERLREAYFCLKKEAARAWTVRHGGTTARPSRTTSRISPID